MNFKRLTLLLCFAALTGCAATPPMSLTKQEQQNLKSVEGTLFIPQNGLAVTVVPTNPGATGLLGALIVAGIDAARRASAEKDAAPMFDQLHDYDFRTVMKQASNDAIATLQDVKFSAPLDVETVNSSTQKRIAYDKSSASAVLFVDVGYQLQSGNLYISANAVMYPKASALLEFRKKPNDADPLDAGNAIYRKTFNFGKQHVAAAEIKGDLTEGANSIASQLAADLNHPL
ncbi:hypothetical protein EN871_15210 [bacterium M00.F.Ca.ET.228.01.1.1]|uniref:Lipoprotein n=1 Tax=Burkholderia sp. (strain CCGE1003) TaxID=640512 RepID=E1TAV3_BURSG|nr:hypothetical protein EN871_15210 [bacterium M00.F.Ca.ET.228.01.1.1]TGS00610.1 hypothetical protein EN834_15205 [bacterium M00.F.Ca.ET.191.01.1.1]TGU04996.1 hypothetical protein EN798_16025 [bacterium M00.F.Ca.ET.155.01.1.1]